jgi:hypothetical protein
MQLPFTAQADAPVQGHAGFGDNQRAPGCRMTGEGLYEPLSPATKDSNIHRNSCCADPIDSAAVHLRVRIARGNDNACNSRLNKQIRARRGSSMVAAGFERDVGGGAPHTATRFANGADLRVIHEPVLVKTTPDNRALPHYDAPDRRVRRGQTYSAPRKFQCLQHEFPVFSKHGRSG